MITNFLNYDKLLQLQNIYSSFESFLQTIESKDDVDLEDFYNFNKSIFNDFITCLSVMKKSKKLMTVILLP